MSVCQGFEYWKIGTVTDVFQESVPEGGDNYREGSVSPGLGLGPGVGIRRSASHR